MIPSFVEELMRQIRVHCHYRFLNPRVMHFLLAARSKNGNNQTLQQKTGYQITPGKLEYFQNGQICTMARSVVRLKR